MPLEPSTTPRHILTVSEENFGLTVEENNWDLTLAYAAISIAPNSVTSETTSDGTADLLVATFEAQTVTGLAVRGVSESGNASEFASLTGYGSGISSVDGIGAYITSVSSTGADIQSYSGIGANISSNSGKIISGNSAAGEVFAVSNVGVMQSTGLNITGTSFTYGTGAAAAHRTALALGTLATQSGTFSGTSSGTNTGDQDLSGYATINSLGTAAAFDVAPTANISEDVVTTAVAQTLTNKTLTSPAINSATIGTAATFNATTYTFGAGAASAMRTALDVLPLAGGTMESGADIIFANASVIREAGAQGLEIECSVGYRWQWVAGRMILRQINSGQILRILAIDEINPSATDDITQGFVPNTRWETVDGAIYICTDATEGAAVWRRGYSGNSSVTTWHYRAKTTITTGDPTDANVIWNNATQINATSINVSHKDQDNDDIEFFLGFIQEGQQLFLQDRDASQNFQIWLVSGTPSLVNGGTANAYFTFPVTLVDSGGTGTTGFANNHQLLFGTTQALALHAPTHAIGGSDPLTPADIGALPLTSVITVTGTTPAFTEPLVDDGSLINGKRVWFSSNQELSWYAGVWTLILNDGDTILYEATNTSDSDRPWLLTGWTVIYGSDQPTLSIDLQTLQPVAGVNGTIAIVDDQEGRVAPSDMTGLGTGVATFLATPSSTNLAAAVTDETGSGSLVFATSPTITTPTIAQINGGIAANDDLTLQGTGSATRTTSYVNLQPNGGNVGIGTATPSATLHTIALTEQMRIGYDAANYTSLTVSSAGNVTRNNTGTFDSQTLSGNQALYQGFSSSAVYMTIGGTTRGDGSQGKFNLFGTAAASDAPVSVIWNTTDNSTGKNAGLVTKTRMTNRYLKTYQTIGQNDNSFGNAGLVQFTAFEYSNNTYTTLATPTEFSGWNYQYYNGTAYASLLSARIAGVGVGIVAPNNRLHIHNTATNAGLDIGGSTTANFTGVGFTPNVTTSVVARVAQGSSSGAGLSLIGFSSVADNSGAVSIFAHSGVTAPTTPVIVLDAYKHNGTTGRAALASTEMATQWRNGGSAVMTLLGGGNLGLGTTTPTAAVDINSNILRIRTAKTPASAAAAGNAGDICWDDSYIYVCTATNTWKRTLIATWV
jgi:hypothetical protein